MENLTTDGIMNDELGLESVLRELDDSWRHGCYVYEVFKRKSDDTFWAVNYQESGDGEYNGIREGDAQIEQVWPHEKVVTTIEYKTKPPTGCP